MTQHRLYTDGETSSFVDINRNLANYWDPQADTIIHCIAYKRDDGPIKIWRAQTENGPDPIPDGLMVPIGAMDDLIVAHKAEFEHYMLHRFFRDNCRNYADPSATTWEIPLTQMRCTMAKAAAMAMPMSLGKLSLALGFPQGKDTAGQKAMKILCKPNPVTGRHWVWTDKGAPELFEALYKYCIHDVQLEYDIDQLLPDLSDEEQAMWVLDQEINRRGIGIDRRATAAMYQMCTQEAERLNTELQTITGGHIQSTSEVVRIANYCGLDSIKKDVLEVVLDDAFSDLTPDQYRVLEIRQEAAKSSVLKLGPMLNLVGSNGRVAWHTQFNGTGTGRFSARGFQHQNFPRGTLHLTEEEQEGYLAFIVGCAPTFPAQIRPGTTNLELASNLLRGLIIAANGYEFSSFDFAGIEMVFGSWFVGDEGLLNVWRGDRKVYEYTYATAFNVDQSTVTKDQRQTGKGMALGAQFGGGEDALIKTAWDLLRMKFDPDPDRAREIAIDLKERWRAAHPNYQKKWKELQKAAIDAVLNPGNAYIVQSGSLANPVIYKVPMAVDGSPGAVLQCTLPSGRKLSYPYPEIKRHTVTKRNGESWETDSLTYMVSDNGKWVKTHSYGGKLFENIVQAMAADLLRFAMINMNNEGIPIIMTVHDEVPTETLRGSMSWDYGREIMERRPAWCSDLPIKVTGWQGRRYRKE